MHLSRLVRTAGAFVLMTLAALVLSACSGGTASTTTSEDGTSIAQPPSSTVPALTDDLIVRLQIRAIQRECSATNACSNEPICVMDDQSPEFAAAVQETFPKGLMRLYGWPLSNPDCVLFITDPTPERLNHSAVGIGIWHGYKHTLWFEWDGHEWIDMTPEEVGVTDTTWVQ